MDNELPHTNISTTSHTSSHFSRLLKASLLLGSSGLLSACAAFFSDQYVDQNLPETSPDAAEISQEPKQKPGPIVSPSIEAPAVVKAEPVKSNNGADFHKPVAPTESADSAGGNKALQAIQAITRSTQISQVGMIDRRVPSSSESVKSYSAAPSVVTPTLQAPVKTVVSNTQPATKTVVESESTAAAVKPIALTPSPKSPKSPQPSNPTVLVAQTNSDRQPVRQAKKQTSHTEPEIAEVNALTEKTPTAAGIAPQSLSPAQNQPVTAVASARKVTANMLDNMQKEFGMWLVQPNNDNVHQGQCKISSATVQLHNNGYSAQLWIDVVDDQLIVNSTANIDIQQNTVGLRFDQGELLPFERKHFRNAAVRQSNVSKLLNSSETLHIYLGGEEFGKQSHYARIDLADLKSAYSWSRKCR